MKTVNTQNLTIVNHNGNYYRVIFAFVTKKDAYNLIKNAVILGEKGTLQNNLLFVYNIKMSSQKIKFGDKDIDKKKFYSSKQAILLDSGDLSKIVVSSRWQLNDTTYKYFCGYLNNDVIKPLSVILRQMNGYIKYFDDGGKNMSFVTHDEKVYEKYDEIWNVVKGLLKLKFAASPIRNDKYILAKLKIFKKKNLTTFNNNIVPIEKNHYICIPAIDIDSVLKIDKKAYA